MPLITTPWNANADLALQVPLSPYDRSTLNSISLDCTIHVLDDAGVGERLYMPVNLLRDTDDDKAEVFFHTVFKSARGQVTLFQGFRRQQWFTKSVNVERPSRQFWLRLVLECVQRRRESADRTPCTRTLTAHS